MEYTSRFIKPLPEVSAIKSNGINDSKYNEFLDIASRFKQSNSVLDLIELKYMYYKSLEHVGRNPNVVAGYLNVVDFSSTLNLDKSVLDILMSDDDTRKEHVYYVVVRDMFTDKFDFERGIANRNINVSDTKNLYDVLYNYDITNCEDSLLLLACMYMHDDYGDKYGSNFYKLCTRNSESRVLNILLGLLYGYSILSDSDYHYIVKLILNVRLLNCKNIFGDPDSFFVTTFLSCLSCYRGNWEFDKKDYGNVVDNSDRIDRIQRTISTLKNLHSIMNSR